MRSFAEMIDNKRNRDTLQKKLDAKQKQFLDKVRNSGALRAKSARKIIGELANIGAEIGYEPPIAGNQSEREFNTAYNRLSKGKVHYATKTRQIQPPKNRSIE